MVQNRPLFEILGQIDPAFSASDYRTLGKYSQNNPCVDRVHILQSRTCETVMIAGKRMLRRRTRTVATKDCKHGEPSSVRLARFRTGECREELHA